MLGSLTVSQLVAKIKILSPLIKSKSHPESIWQEATFEYICGGLAVPRPIETITFLVYYDRIVLSQGVKSTIFCA